MNTLQRQIARLTKDKKRLMMILAATLSIALNIYFFSLFVDANDLSWFNTASEDTEFLDDEEAELEENGSNLVVFKPVENGLMQVDLRSNLSLESILKSGNITYKQIADISTAISKYINPNSIKVGSRVELEVGRINAEKELGATKVIIYQDRHKVEAKLDIAQNKIIATKTEIPLSWQLKLVSGTINGSLFASMKRSGADANITSQLSKLFSHNIDFQRDLKSGDVFKIMYEYQTDFRGKLVKNPKILYASLNLRGKNHELYRHELAGGSVEYYDNKGMSIKKSLLRTPVNSAKISSRFGMREHPVHGYSKMHQGLDYSAPKGTPILAAGDGTVTYMKSLHRGYGKHVEIKHNSSYSTMYAHMSRFASSVKPGTKVKQGQVIGYVGATGTATGAHLHYEVIHNGKKVNPAKVNAPMAQPLQGKELAKFRDGIRKLDQMVAGLDYKKSHAVAQK